MKKLISFFLILSLCMCCMPAFAQAADITAGDSILSVNGVVSGKIESGYASIQTNFTNNTEKDASITMIMAEYNVKDGYKSLVSTSKETKFIPAGKSASASPGIKISSKNAQIRYFAYNSATLEPLVVKEFVTENFKLTESDEDTTVYNIYSFDDMQSTNIGTDLTETLSNPEICTWQGNKKSATSITLDDGV